jgi:hypothetical protein
VNVFARLCLVLGGLFVADAVIYWSLQHEHVGTALLAMTAVGFIFTGLYMAMALRKARRRPELPVAEEAHVRGTIWPAVFAVSAVGLTLGVLVTPWLLVVGGVLFAAAGAGWTAETRRQWGGVHPVQGEHPHQGDGMER